MNTFTRRICTLSPFPTNRSISSDRYNFPVRNTLLNPILIHYLDKPLLRMPPTPKAHMVLLAAPSKTPEYPIPSQMLALPVVSNHMCH
ncbi:hypothetical protein M758_UG320700 [Ceratodon purpureus]|nr:hypothetical protein M758_UG320700 [Ceratodon purpureus]